MVKKRILNSDKKKEIKIYIGRLLRNGLPIDRLIIFGSHAKGTAKPWSDVDLCVVSKRFGGNRHTDRVWLMKFRDRETLDIEPHPYNPKDLEDKWDPLANEIRKYGIPWKEVAP